jgi:hypothetical protein
MVASASMRNIVLALCIFLDLNVVSSASCTFSAFVKPTAYRIAKSSVKKGICQATTLKRKESEPEDDDAAPLPWPPVDIREKQYSLGKGEVAVRFINAPGRSPSNGKNDVRKREGQHDEQFLHD